MPEAHRVFLHGAVVGVLQRAEVGFSLVFEPEYRDLVPRPVLGQWFVDRNLEKRITFKRLPIWFHNLLPEGWLRDVISDQVGPDKDEFDMLGVIGADLPGAITIEPLHAPPTSPAVRGESIATDGEFLPIGANNELRFSLAGVQPKLSVDRADRVTVPVHGRNGRWILKFPDQKHPELPEVEYSMMRWAQLSGFEVPEIALVRLDEVIGLPDSFRMFADRYGYICRRFDRPGAESRLHIEDFAQILNVHPDDKYGEIGGASYIRIGRVFANSLPVGDTLKFVRRLAFDVICGNGDSHLKNWSLQYPDRLNALISPCYDIVSTIVFDNYLPKLALTFVGERSMHAFTEATVAEFAWKIGISKDAALDAALSTARAARSVFDHLLPEMPISDVGKSRLKAHVNSIKFGK